MSKNEKSQGTAQAAADKVKDLERQLSESRKQVEALRKELSQKDKAGEQLQGAYDKICEEYNSLFKANGEMEDKHQKEIQQYKDGVERAEQAAKQAITEFNGVNEILSQVKEDLNSEREENSRERLLKNEAYAFILSEGLIDKFLDFREPFHRTRSQDISYNLAIMADIPDFWIAGINWADYTDK